MTSLRPYRVSLPGTASGARRDADVARRIRQSERARDLHVRGAVGRRGVQPNDDEAPRELRARGGRPRTRRAGQPSVELGEQASESRARERARGSHRATTREQTTRRRRRIVGSSPPPPTEAAGRAACKPRAQGGYRARRAAWASTSLVQHLLVVRRRRDGRLCGALLRLPGAAGRRKPRCAAESAESAPRRAGVRCRWLRRLGRPNARARHKARRIAPGLRAPAGDRSPGERRGAMHDYPADAARAPGPHHRATTTTTPASRDRRRAVRRGHRPPRRRVQRPRGARELLPRARPARRRRRRRGRPPSSSGPRAPHLPGAAGAARASARRRARYLDDDARRGLVDATRGARRPLDRPSPPVAAPPRRVTPSRCCSRRCTGPTRQPRPRRVPRRTSAGTRRNPPPEPARRGRRGAPARHHPARTTLLKTRKAWTIPASCKAPTTIRAAPEPPKSRQTPPRRRRAVGSAATSRARWASG